jgi:predicted RND superfamily exporter protein
MVLAAVTVFMAIQASQVKMSYKFGGLLPENDSTHIKYQEFTREFSEDGNVIIVGVNDRRLFELENFQRWYDLSRQIKKISVPTDTVIKDIKIELSRLAIDSVFSIASCYNIVKDDSLRKFGFEPLITQKPRTQEEVDSLRSNVKRLPFYEGLLYKDDSEATLMMIFVNSEIFNSENRGNSVQEIQSQIARFSAETGIPTYVTGLPLIRIEMLTQVKDELRLFLILAALVTAVLLYLFFRNFGVVIVCMVVVAIGVVWSLGAISLLDYRISMLMGLIPPLVIVIGVTNCIYLLNKYHSEFKKHGNKVKSLTRVVQKIGNATFMTNATTALGFATFIFTHSNLLREFGVAASLNIMAVFLISVLTIPAVFSFLPEPKRKHVRHLDRRWLFIVVNQLVHIVQKKRRPVYILSLIVLVVSLFGMTLMKTTGNIVGDFPSDAPVIQDLQWFEENFNGTMPFEIVIDAKKKGQITNSANMQKIDRLQSLLSEYPEFSRSLSIVDASKFARQAFYNGDPDRYGLIKRNEKSFIGPYFQGEYETKGVERTFIDSTKRKTRVTANIADIGSDDMEVLLADLRPRIDSIFVPEKYEVTLTGTSVVFLEGTTYMVRNLLISLLIAICAIAIIMSFLFKSARMVLISLLPNMGPLIITAAIMGFVGIPLKPSTILVFSIAFGISVDDTIHFLAKYRQELKLLRWNIKRSVILAVKETGVSMMYTSVVLFFGFAIFVASEFDGTRALGVLVSVTLLVAMFTNLVLLPSLLLSYERSLTTRSFSEPFLEIIDEEEDIELEELEVRKGLYNRE